jgi:uncharacterized protein
MSSAEVVCIFPLPQVALFPHAILPLHVFEPRYREMVRDCLAGDRRMAVAALAPGYETSYHERPPVRAVCGVGEVVAHEALADGRSNILLRGVARGRIVEELPPTESYRRVRWQPIEDRLPPGFDGPRALSAMILLADQIALKLPSGQETLRELARSQPAPGPLTDVLAAALVTDPDARQSLLEEPDVAVRVERVSERLASILLDFSEKRGPAN